MLLQDSKYKYLLRNQQAGHWPPIYRYQDQQANCNMTSRNHSYLSYLKHQDKSCTVF